MRDTISIPRVKNLHPLIATEVERLIDEAEKAFPDNIAVRVVQGWRTFQEQDALYAQGRTTAGAIVTKAQGGFSNHNYGLSFDGAILDHGRLVWGSAYWKEVVKVFLRSGHWRWGGDWDCDGLTKADGDKDEHLVDYPHLEKQVGLTLREMLVKHNNEDFIPNTKYITIP